MRLVAPDGGQIGIKSIDEAKWLAQELGLDLVEVAAEARPPVVRMMDYGKFKYEQSVRDRAARKKQTRTVVKEVQFRPKIGDSDFQVKRRRVERFLAEGDKVKCTLRFRGREVTHPELGRKILERLMDELGELAVVETMPKFEGRQITMVLVPGKRPVAAVAEEEVAAGEDGSPDSRVAAEAAPSGAPAPEETLTEEGAAAEPVGADDEGSAEAVPADEE